MIQAIIIDDEPLARSMVAEYLAAYPNIIVVAECGDGFEGMKAIQQHQPQLVFLDIQMPKISGFEMLELLDAPPGIIFTTAFDEYALKAFEMNAIDYLLKPFSQQRFNKAMDKWLQIYASGEANASSAGWVDQIPQQDTQRERVVVKNGTVIKVIPVQDIFYLESADDFVKLHTKDGNFLKHKTMAFFEQTLDAGRFTRTHRSYMVQVAEITRLEPYEKENYLAILRNGSKVPVSKSGYARLRSILGL